MNKWIRAIGAGLLVAVWLGLAGWLWFGPKTEFSDAERRPLAEAPELNKETLLNGSFMKEFESYTLDQFPMRDDFRQLKSMFHYYVLRQKDNNDIYVEDGYAAKLEYQVEQEAVDHALKLFNNIYKRFLKEKNTKVYLSIVPDKSYYLAEANGYLSLDYDAFFKTIQDGMPWATPIDITGSLDITDYYYTDTHWRQEELFDAAAALCNGLGVTAPKREEYTRVALERPFYGVYYGQAALPMDPDTMYILKNDLLDSYVTALAEQDPKTGAVSYKPAYESVYDLSKQDAKDMYEVYLSGSQSILRIENPNATTDRELIIFRDSFGSSMAPLLAQDYRYVTLVDIRHISSSMLNRFLDFENKDVLFLYSTSVLNNPGTNFKP